MEPPIVVSDPPEARTFTQCTLADMVAAQETGRRVLDDMLHFLKYKVIGESPYLLRVNWVVGARLRALALLAGAHSQRKHLSIPRYPYTWIRSRGLIPFLHQQKIPRALI